MASVSVYKIFICFQNDKNRLMNLVWFVFYSMHSDCSVHDIHYMM